MNCFLKNYNIITHNKLKNKTKAKQPVKQTKWQPHHIPPSPSGSRAESSRMRKNGKSNKLNPLLTCFGKQFRTPPRKLARRDKPIPHNLRPSGIQHLRLLVGRCTCNAHQHQTTSLRPRLRSLPLLLPLPPHTILFTVLLPRPLYNVVRPSGVKTIPPRVVGITHRVFMTRTAMMKSQTSPPFA